MKATVFKAGTVYETHKKSLKAILFHGDVDWYVHFCAEDFCSKKNIAWTSYISAENISEYLSRSQQQKFFDDQEDAQESGAIINAVEQVNLKHMKACLALGHEGPLIFTSEGYLRPSSPIRKYFEKEDVLMIVPVYAPNMVNMGAYIRSFFIRKNLSIDSDCLRLLSQHLMHCSEHLNNVLNIIALYHLGQSVTYAGMMKCLSAMHMQSDVMQPIEAFCLRKKEQFLHHMAQFNMHDTSSALFFLRLLQDACITLYLLKHALISPSDYRLIKWPFMTEAQKIWNPEQLKRILVRMADAEVWAKQQSIHQELLYFFQCLI